MLDDVGVETLEDVDRELEVDALEKEIIRMAFVSTHN